MCWLWAKTQCNAHKATTAKLNLRKLIIQTGSAKANKVIWVKYFIFPCFVQTARGITQIWGDMSVVERKLGSQNNQQTGVLCYFLFPCSVPFTEGILNKTGTGNGSVLTNTMTWVLKYSDLTITAILHLDIASIHTDMAKLTEPHVMLWGGDWSSL